MSGANGRNGDDGGGAQPDADAALDERLDAMPREVPPKGDLWPGIAARLEPRTAEELAALDRRTPVPARRSSRFGTWQYALAAGVAAIGFAVLVLVAVEQRGPGGAPARAANEAAQPATGAPAIGAPAIGAPVTPAGAAAPSPLLAAAFEGPQDERYRRTRAALEKTFREGLAVLAPETRTRIEQNLEVIRRANADIRAALASDPNSPLLHQLLESTWQQEIDLYTTVGRNVNPALPRTRT